MHDALWIQLIQRKVFYEHYLRQKSQLLLVHMQCRQKGEAGRSEASKQVQIALQYGLSRQASRPAGGFGGKKHEILLRVASIIISGEFENCFESKSFTEFTKCVFFICRLDVSLWLPCLELYRICPSMVRWSMVQWSNSQCQWFQRRINTSSLDIKNKPLYFPKIWRSWVFF